MKRNRRKTNRVHSPATAMEDFNIPSAERVAVLKRLQDAIGDVQPYFWAACQVCDLKALEKLVDIASITPAAVHIIAGQCRTMARYWSANPPKGLSQSSTPKKSTLSNLGSSPATSTPASKRRKISNAPGSPMPRDGPVKALAKQRDNSRCVLTKEGATDVAHIYPFHSLNHKEEIFGQRRDFWNLLRSFWPEEKVATWEALLFPRGIHELGMERVDNLITLGAQAHRIWGEGAFALKPISMSNDKKTLKVQFFWQKSQNIQAPISLLTAPFSTKDLDQYERNNDTGPSMLFDYTTRKPIESGQFIELQTDNPTKKPLPNIQLLEMQWFLQRVAGMAGAASDFDWDDWEEDSDGEISNLGLDEVGDSSNVSTDDPDSSPDTSLPVTPEKLRKNNSSLVSTDPDSSLVSAQTSLPVTPKTLRKTNSHYPEGSKHHIEEAEEGGEGIGDRYGTQVTM